MAQSRDAVWLPVLPSMRDFGPALIKEAGNEAEKSGKKVGQRFGRAVNTGFAVVTAGAVLVTGWLYKTGETFRKMENTIRVGTGATGKALEDLVGSAKNVGLKVPASFEDIGEAVADVNTNLGLTGDTLETFASQALEAGRMLGEKIDIKKVSRAFNAFKVEGDATIDAMDRLYQVSQATGVGINELAGNVQAAAPALVELGFSFEETAALVGNLDKAGLSSSKMMAGMSRALVNLAKDGEAPQDAFQRVTQEVKNYLDAGDRAAAIDLASKLFGTRNAAQFIGAVESGALALDELGQVAGMTSDTILDASKDTQTFSDKWKIFKNRILAQLEPVATRVFDAITDAMDTLTNDILPQFIAGWKGQDGPAGIFRDLGRVLSEVTTFVRDHKTAVFALVGAFAAAKVAILAVTAVQTIQTGLLLAGKAAMLVVRGALMAWTAAQWLLNVALTANPIGLIIVAIGALVAGLVLAWKKSETFRNIVTGVWNTVRDAVIGAWTNYIKPAVDAMARFFRETLPGAFRRGKDTISNVWNRVTGIVSGAWNNGIKPVVDTMGEFFREKLPGWIRQGKDTISNIWKGVKEIFAKPINWVLNTVWNNGLKKAFDNVASVVGIKTRLPAAPNIPTRAKGGYTSPGWTLVGEEGPELVNFSHPNRVYTAAETARALAAGRDISPELEARAIGRTPAESLLPAGGFFGDVWDHTKRAASAVGNTIKNAAGQTLKWARGGLAKAASMLLEPIRGVVRNTVGQWGNFGQMIQGTAFKGIDWVLDWVRGQDSEPLAKTGATLPKATRGGFHRPSAGPITSRYGPRWGSFHSGIDIAGGGPTYAAWGGTVAKTGWNILPGRTGIGILLDHGAGLWTYYGHNPVGGVKVRDGQVVKAGQRIGTQGATGNVTGVHVHFEEHRGRPGRAVDPGHLFGSAGRARQGTATSRPKTIPTFLRDQGGPIPPGLSMVLNKTGRSEQVFNHQQMRALSERIRGNQFPQKTILQVGARDFDGYMYELTDTRLAHHAAGTRQLARQLGGY